MFLEMLKEVRGEHGCRVGPNGYCMLIEIYLDIP